MGIGTFASGCADIAAVLTVGLATTRTVHSATNGSPPSILPGLAIQVGFWHRTVHAGSLPDVSVMKLLPGALIAHPQSRTSSDQPEPKLHVLNRHSPPRRPCPA